MGKGEAGGRDRYSHLEKETEGRGTEGGGERGGGEREEEGQEEKKQKEEQEEEEEEEAGGEEDEPPIPPSNLPHLRLCVCVCFPPSSPVCVSNFVCVMLCVYVFSSSLFSSMCVSLCVCAFSSSFYSL